MDCRVRAGLECQAALIQAEIDLLGVSIDEHELACQGKKRRRRRWWCRSWLSPERRRHFGLYDQLMTELRREDQKAFVNFLRISPEMFDEILERVGPRITRQRTHYRDPLHPGLKLAITLRHLASGSKYANMKFAWRVPHNTISVVVRVVSIF